MIKLNTDALKTSFLASLALVAFAANSLFARAAIGFDDSGQNLIGGTEFTVIRLVSGAVFLIFLYKLKNNNFAPYKNRLTAEWLGAIFLLIYAICFSFAYTQMDTAMGAIVLFTAVQFTIIGSTALGVGLRLGEVIGSIVSFLGFLYLIVPNISVVDNNTSPISIILMCVSGIAWGLYTIKGRSCKTPLIETRINFSKAAILAAPLLVGSIWQYNISISGVILALMSGMLASGAGYAIWFSVLPRLSSSIAASSQLLVPLIAAFLGWVFLDEVLTFQFMIASIVILSGLAIVIFAGTNERLAHR